MPDTDIMISELPAASAATAADQLEANQSGTTRRVTLDQVTSLVAASPQVGDAIDDAISEIPSGWVQLTQAEYDALSPPDPDTLYIVVG